MIVTTMFFFFFREKRAIIIIQLILSTTFPNPNPPQTYGWSVIQLSGDAPKNTEVGCWIHMKIMINWLCLMLARMIMIIYPITIIIIYQVIFIPKIMIYLVIMVVMTVSVPSLIIIICSLVGGLDHFLFSPTRLGYFSEGLNPPN